MLIHRSPEQPAWRPSSEVELPAMLRFETWWFESGQRFTMHVAYDTAAKVCNAR